MLPPQRRGSSLLVRRHTLSTATVLPATVMAVRTFWSWRTARNEYTSQQDPLYQRFTRYRTMKTRAQLLEKLKRRGKFEWDLNQRPFFTPKSIVRSASHSPYNGRPPPPRSSTPPSISRTNEGEGEDGSGYELSQREKEWKDRMEYMRKRIETDPYEAVFGKRFEPFWSPLVPGWMREDMGLRTGGGRIWPQKVDFTKDEVVRKDGVRKGREAEDEQVDMGSKQTAEGSGSGQRVDGMLGRGPAAGNGVSGFKAIPTNQPAATSRHDAKAGTPEKSNASTAPPSKSVPYSSYTSTSWDSRTQKTKRTEWDSASGQAKRFEYDPVSNRMVELRPPRTPQVSPLSGYGKPGAVKAVSESTKTVTVTNESGKAVEVRRSDDMRSLINTPREKGTAVELPIKKSFAVAEASVHSMEAALAKLEYMTRDLEEPAKSTPTHIHVRDEPSMSELADGYPTSLNSVGWVPHAAPRQREKVQERRPVGFAPLPPSETVPPSGLRAPKSAKLAKLPARDEDMLTADEVRAKMGKVKNAMREPARTAEEKAELERAFENSGKEWEKLLEAQTRHRDTYSQKSAVSAVSSSAPATLKTSLERRAAAPSPHATVIETKTTQLQPSVDRMPRKDTPAMNEDLDDAAAHESTEPLTLPPSVPKGWSEAADILQADRVKRTAAKKPFPKPMVRWVDDMEAKKAAHKAAAHTPVISPEQVAEKERLERANALLAAEVEETKARMQAFEGKYKRKMQGLRGELDLAYRQSATHGEKHVERIRFLEGELAKQTKSVGGESAVKEGVASQAGVQDAALIQGEGDFAPDIAKWVDNGKWYKQPALRPAQTQTRQEIERMKQKASDQALVREVREVYERAYGVIDAGHKQPRKAEKADMKVVEVESDIDLGEALAEHEKNTSYAFKDDGLEKEIQAREKEAHEAQAKTEPSAAGLEVRIMEADAKGRYIQSEIARIDAETAAEEAAKTKQEQSIEPSSTIQWQQPPVYKILAYDSANDVFSQATTTANFTGTETAIDIPQALSQLYQPARFVPHFAKLQEEGWQVIHGTSDLLVFKKVAVPKPVIKAVEEQLIDETAGLVDHGVITPKENAVAQEAANFYDHFKPEPQPYDPTSIENGKLMPYENAMAQEAAHAYDAAVAARSAVPSAEVNPIDGMTKPPRATEVSTGHFASPTGFVNHDRGLLDEQEVSRVKVKDAMNEKDDPVSADEVTYAHCPRIRRQEDVFSGMRRATPSSRRRSDKLHKSHDAKRRRRGGAIKWAVGVGVGAAGVAYAVGVAAEMARQERKERQEHKERERWREIVEARRRNGFNWAWESDD